MSVRRPGRIAVAGLGVRLDVVCDDEEARRYLTWLLEDLLVEATTPPDTLAQVHGHGPWDVSSPGHLAHATDEASLTVAVTTAVNLTLVGSTRLLAAHAAVLSLGQRVLVVPGPSGMGKSTLTACLLQRGWDYVSDEALGLAWQTGDITAYPRPLSLSAWSADQAGVTGTAAVDGTTEEQVVGIARQGWRTAHRVGPVTDVVLLRRGQGAPRLQPVPAQDAVTELLRRSFTHFLDPAGAMLRFAAVADAASCRQLTLGDPRAAADLLTDRGPG